MSGKLKEVRNRISSVKSTQQITKAMKMVSAAKLRKAQEKITQMRPYADKLKDILKNIASSEEGGADIDFLKDRNPEKVLVISISSDRGLCGSFNSNVIKTTTNRVHGSYKEQYENGNVTLLCIGKKTYEHFSKRGYNVIDKYVNLFEDLTFEKAAQVAEFAMNEFTKGNYDRIGLVYAKFKNAATQSFGLERFLPIEKNEEEEEVMESAVDYIYEPSKEYLVQELIPKILKTQVYKALLDSNASEHGARMTAMDKATDNANELLKDLKLSYNRARQAAITTELTEIVSGAAALENV